MELRRDAGALRYLMRPVVKHSVGVSGILGPDPKGFQNPSGLAPNPGCARVRLTWLTEGGMLV